PRADPDVSGYLAGYFKSQQDDWRSWYEQRSTGDLGAAEQRAAEGVVLHAGTPTTAHFDTPGRAFLTVAPNRFKRCDVVADEYANRVELDAEGNQRVVRDASVQNGDTLGRIVMHYDYNLIGKVIHQASMEAGERWTLEDVAGKPIRAWDSRGHASRMQY